MRSTMNAFLPGASKLKTVDAGQLAGYHAQLSLDLQRSTRRYNQLIQKTVQRGCFGGIDRPVQDDVR